VADLMGCRASSACRSPIPCSTARGTLGYTMAHHWDMAVLPWGLLEAGILTGKFLKNVSDPTRIDQKELKLSEKGHAVVKEVEKIAQETGKPMSQVAINWVRQNPNAL